MLWGHMSIWGHLGTLGSKGHFHYKCYNLSILHSMTIGLIHVDQLETLVWLYGVKCQSGVIWGHWGRKVICTKECYNSSMLHSMTIRLIQVNQLETLYLCYGVICQSGVIWGHWGQKVIFTINAITCPCYIAWPEDSYMFISLRPSTCVMGLNVNLGSFGVTVVKFWFSFKMQ